MLAVGDRRLGLGKQVAMSQGELNRARGGGRWRQQAKLNMKANNKHGQEICR